MLHDTRTKVHTPWYILLLLFFAPTLQIDVEFVQYLDQRTYCHDLLPGQCCVPNGPSMRRPYPEPPSYSLGPFSVTIKKLLINEVAAIWEDWFDVYAGETADLFCSSTPNITLIGPKNVRIEAWDDPLANYQDPQDHRFSGVS